jgi:hypothetical protein
MSMAQQSRTESVRYRRSAWGRVAVAAMVCGALTGFTRHVDAVVIHEIHYLTPEDDTLEFIELFNPSDAAVSLAGWRIDEGVRLEFSAGASIPARGFVIVCRFIPALAEAFDLPESILVEWIGSRLDNGGERIALVDADGILVDEVSYDDDPPWDGGADGSGSSLQRICADDPSQQVSNWVSAAPTPLAVNAVSVCPSPSPPPPRVAISEIYYHPLDDEDETLEYVELTNTTDETVDLDGYSFTDGFEFVFPAGTSLGAGEIVVVCRDQSAVRDAFGIDNTVGDFVGFLSNDGERVTLVDDRGDLVDSARYRDHGDWDVSADGYGFSLEKIALDALSDDPASWSGSGAGSTSLWRSASVVGELTNSRLLFYLGGVGEMLIDDVSLVEFGGDGEQHVPGGSFDDGIDGWTVGGTHSDSRWDSESGSLRIVASSGGGGSANSASVTLVGGPDVGGDTRYRLTFSYFGLVGDNMLTVRLIGSSPSRGLFYQSGEGAAVSPGLRNNVDGDSLPPFISDVARIPLEPRSSDRTTIRARVRGDTSGGVRLIRAIGDAMREFDMQSDGDGLFSVELPRVAHDTAVRFHIVASSATSERSSPPPHDPAGSHGYYVNNDQPDSVLPVYHLLLPPELGANPRDAIARLSCGGYSTFSFAHRGDLYPDVLIRRRGQSVCGDRDVIKKYLRVRFHRGHEFNGYKHLNFQSLWTDKSLLRENMAWTVFREMANPWIRHEYVRLHANGDYFGLYAEMERLDAEFLERHGLDPDGSLYKAVASSEQRDGVYERKTGDESDFTDLRAFLNELHDTPNSQLADFFSENVEEDAIIDYLGSHVLINNGDYGHKNHYLYKDPTSSRWRPLPWDLDLSYGKRWDGQFGGVLNDRMNSPGISPWNGTTVRGGGVGNHLLDKFFSRAGTKYRRAHIVRLWDALAEKYTIELYEDRVADLRELLIDEQQDDFDEWGRSPATADAPDAPEEFEPNIDRLLEHIRERRSYLLSYLRNRESFRGHDRVKITEVMYNPPGNDDGEFLELWNNSGESIDISGWTIQGLEVVSAEGVERRFEFPPDTTLARGEVIVVAKNPTLFEVIHGDGVVRLFGPYPGRLSNAGERLRVKDTGPGYPATVDHLEYGASLPWPRLADGFGSSLELVGVTPDRDNDPPEHWRASPDIWGSPGVVHGPVDEIVVSRGDCNGDGHTDVSDAVSILRHLFAGLSITCRDGCDADGDGDLSVGDAIGVLSHLYSPDGFDIPSPGPQECATIEGGACDASNCVAD